MRLLAGKPGKSQLAPFGEWDIDANGVPDRLEAKTRFEPGRAYFVGDADRDGLSNAVEGNGDPDLDGIPSYLDEDSDNNGIPDRDEGVEDADADGVPDFLDPDNDGDGLTDALEGSGDADGDGIPNLFDLDSDANGLPDAEEGLGDPDGDGVPDFVDADNNGDGRLDIVESAIGFHSGASPSRLVIVQSLRGSGKVKGLAGAIDIAPSPLGDRVYTAGYRDSTVGVFERDAMMGEVRFIEAISMKNVRGNALEGARALAFSHDGRHIYVAAREGNAISVFAIRDEIE
jgi:hypothetical protein